MQKKKKQSNSLKPKINAFDIVNYSVLTIFGLLCLFPMVYELLLSVASKGDFLTAKLLVIPKEFHIEAYKFIFGKQNIGRAFLISAFLTIVTTLYSLVLTSFGAFAFSRKNVPGLKIFFTLIIITMFFSGGIIPFYLTVEKLIGINNLWCLIIPFGTNTFNMIILRNFFLQVPESLLESCRIEGASEFRILFQFVLPLSKAGIATVMLWLIVGNWDAWYWPSFFLRQRTDLYPLALTLRNALMALDGNALDTSVKLDGTKLYSQGNNAAMIMVSITPILCIYPFFQKYFVKGVMVGSVKE